jgi:hypothetical protein
MKRPPPDGRRQAVAAREEAERTEAAYKDVSERLRVFEGRVAAIGGPAESPLKDLRQRLEPGDVFLWYATLDQRVAVLVADRDGARVVDLGLLAPMTRACEALRDAGRSSKAAELARAVRERVLDPIGLGPKVARLLVSPQGPVAWVPWRQVLEGDRTGVDVVLVPSASVFARLRSEPHPPGQGVLALGGCDYGAAYDRHAIAVYRHGRPFDPLPASGPEAVSVAPPPGNVALLGPLATVTELRARLERPHPRWRALHFACHGVINDRDPMLSALALTAGEGDDGLLRASDILGIRLDADLVTLSACESGVETEVAGRPTTRRRRRS